MSSLISARAALGRYPMLLHAINPFPSVMMSASTSENTLPSRNRPPSRDNLTSTPLSYKEYRNRNKARISRPDQPTYDTLVFVIQLLNRGAPKMAGDISMLTQGQVGAWIQQVRFCRRGARGNGAGYPDARNQRPDRTRPTHGRGWRTQRGPGARRDVPAGGDRVDQRGAQDDRVPPPAPGRLPRATERACDRESAGVRGEIGCPGGDDPAV
ncbi:hypothetical protein CALCODRAFT_204534 [Calocera cornea HHB12733]|uniref:Uncharacterized protein n=1 Tax=Calocera cornea HHB12733 TaxID=1353952 RepID=A0A165JZY7_9BASI|nr:hypothetical protein CALCODRAFT_204534 [Calocera cornea HHB12733]